MGEDRFSDAEVTPELAYLQRRRFMALALSVLGTTLAPLSKASSDTDAIEKLTPYNKITRYNNYYEFSTKKEAVSILAQELTISPWQITVEGEVESPIAVDIRELVGNYTTDEYIYPLRCVEGWSMIIPWQGFQLYKLLEQVKPTSKAKYVTFVGALNPKEMIGQRRPVLDWPYVEGLRIDEAMHPLTILATGLYGKDMPKQNGAPIRLVVPWKYGFKSIKAITKIILTEKQPATSWVKSSPSEYGFYANVNPAVAHPRWSQRREVRIGEVVKRKTKAFNGFEKQVSHLYKGMDLEKNF